MSDDDDDNVVNFPDRLHGKVTVDSFQSTEHKEYVTARKAVYKCVEELMETIEQTDDIVGVVCLTFDKNNMMHDKKAGNISATNLYVMLEKVKIDVMNLICDTMGYTDPLMEE